MVSIPDVPNYFVVLTLQHVKMADVMTVDEEQFK